MGLQLLEQACLKLAYPFAGDVVALPDFPQRDRIVGQEAVPSRDMSEASSRCCISTI